MTLRIKLLCSLFFLSLTTTYCQGFEPLELAKQIFSKESIPDIYKYSTGEYSGHPNGQDMQNFTSIKFTLLGQTENKAVVGMTILDSSGKGFDTYLHFEKDTIWKINAFRGLALTGMIEQMVQELEKLTPAQIEALIKSETGVFKSKEDFDFQLGNAKLTIELDDNIIKHFLTNQAEFEHLKNLALQQMETEKINDNERIKLVENLSSEYHKIFISSISTGDDELGKGINFLIGGMTDNTVGYLFVKDKKDLPEMSPDNIIMLKEIGNGWYIYKTT